MISGSLVPNEPSLLKEYTPSVCAVTVIVSSLIVCSSILRLMFTSAVPLSETTNIAVLEKVISDQRQIFMNVFNESDVTNIPQMWALC